MKRVTKWFGPGAVVALVAATVLAATAGSASSPAAAAGPKSSSATALTPPKNCTRQAMSYGIAGGGITSLDPSTISAASQWVIMPLLFPGLVKYQPDGTVVPDLATKWKASPDDKTWWFWLRRNVRYADGRQWTSADAVAQILHDLDPKTASAADANIKDIQSVRAIGKYELRFRTGSADAILPDQLFLVGMGDPTNYTGGNGPGPYKVSNYVPNQTLTLVPNKYYFGTKPCLQKIVVVPEPDPTSMTTAFTSGKLGMIWQVAPTDVPKIQADKTATIISPKTYSSVHVFLTDMSTPPFNNPLAREALSYATDRVSMVKAALLGQANPSLTNDLLSTTSPGYDKNLKPQTFDLNKAKQLFQQAGVAPGTTFTFWAQSGKRPEWITMGEILQADLQKIGYNLNIVQSDPATWQAKFVPAGKQYPGLIVADFLSLQPNPALGLSFATAGKCECNWNMASSSSAGDTYNTYYQTLLKVYGTTDPTAQQQLYDQLQELFQKESAIDVVAQMTNIVAEKKVIHGAWEDPRGDVHLENAWITR
jgi:peptide/nickel transport system substrate-binding protein